jgi:uncharacterized protein YcbX
MGWKEANDRRRDFARFEVRRFRPNIVLESTSGENDFIENLWVGKKLMIGEEILLSVTGPCTRCVMTTLPQGDLPQDLGVLRTVAKYNQVHAGVYASVHRGGIIHRGDRRPSTTRRVRYHSLGSLLENLIGSNLNALHLA